MYLGFQIVNDRGVGGKCYGFVTFTNPRSAEDAIKDMNGRVSLYLSFIIITFTEVLLHFRLYPPLVLLSN